MEANMQTHADSWEGTAAFLLGLGLEGPLADCPACGRQGLPLTKWVKGPKVKPISVCHPNGGGRFNVCELDAVQAKSLRTRVGLSRADVERIMTYASPYVLFSGGKDSLVTLSYMKQIADSVGRSMVALHVDTTVGFPEVEEYVADTCRQFGVVLEIVRPQTDYFSMARNWGIPAFNSRWCCRELKIKPISDYLKQVPGRNVVFDGIRAAESAVRAKYMPYWFHPGFECLSVSPIFDWSDEDVLSYIQRQGLPAGSHLGLGTSAECWCGAYKTRSDFEALCHLNPELFEKLAQVEESNRNGFTFIYENGQRISLKSIRNAQLSGV